ncbi:MAG: hypothetical protein U0893_01050 [Chloroflexota bacterium]
MALSVKDVRFTTRRDGNADPLLYPRLLKDRAILASIDVARQYFETMLGEERRALDPEALVHFFGDYKVARGMVASLGRTYRYRAPRVEEVVSRTAWRRLQRAGLDEPGALRVLLWDAANADRSGFLDGQRRLDVFGGLEGKYALRAGQLDRLVALDAPEYAILTRLGHPPTAADVLAEYRRGAVAALLAHAERVELTLGRGAVGQLERIGALAEIERVDLDLVAEAGFARVAVRGRPDAFGSWARQGRRVARFVARLLERLGQHVEDGTATLMVRGRRARLRLSGETLGSLLPGPDRAPRPADGWDVAEGWDDATVAAGIGPGQASVSGWLVRRDPEPRAWASGMLVPDLLIRPARGRAGGPAAGLDGRGGVFFSPTRLDLSAGVLVCLVRTDAQAQRLADMLPALRGGEPLLFAGPGSLVEPLRDRGGWTVELEQPALAPIVAVIATRALSDGPLDAEEPAAARRRRRVA